MNLLEGNTVLLRAPEPEDLENLYRWENDTDIWQVSNTLVPFSRFMLRSYIENAHRDIFEAQQIRFMIDAIDHKPFQTIGSIDVFDFDPYHNRAGVGILIGKSDDRGKGYATEALRVLIRYAFSILKLHQLYCNISTTNLHSLNLFQNCGFEISGEKKEWIKSLDSWHNEYLLQLINRQ